MLSGLERGTLTLGFDDVVVLDEAGMVGTRDMARLVETTKESGAKLVLVGDPRQLPNHHTFERTCGRRCLKFMGSGGAGRIRRCRRGNRALSWGRYRIVQ